MTDNVVSSEFPPVYVPEGKQHHLSPDHPEFDIRNVDSTPASPKCGQKCCTEPSLPESTVSYYATMNDKFEPIEQQLQNLLNTADEFQAHLVYRHDHLQTEGLARVVPNFLRTCQPYFTYLESTARSSMPQRTPMPPYVRTRLLQFSQQLCSRLEQLVLMYASFNFLSLEETDPLSISHFYIGQCRMDCIKVSAFRYCRPTPFLAGAEAGPGSRLYKRMRWNVERPRAAAGKTDRDWEEKKERGRQGSNTEYYFLCYEDGPERWSEGDGERGGERGPETERRVGRSWSIGQWVQTDPDPEEEDIYEWVLCSVPLGQYKHLLCLGTEEPSVSIATDCLLEALLSQEGQGDGTVTTRRETPTYVCTYGHTHPTDHISDRS
ncbi:hypothetical protein AAFF_G00239170 [Aldrovandia affinis]|uniref:Uncharacterized protein n=1 Tax=Aldrovandia affinis TaxID=143900 RepID=A0AAD7RDY4_9TELE|nr:hypothetical protein AAFF_G00239170 [Aldrovandia affinis]